jgi:TRAP-type transport system periplasmic protein
VGSPSKPRLSLFAKAKSVEECMKNFNKAVSILVVGLTCCTLSSVVHADNEIKFGTIAPKNSKWGKVFKTWGASVAELSKGELKITFFHGSQGGEGAMIDKIKAGSQLDGAAVTGNGLSKIWSPYLVLQMPGVFKKWSSLDKARNAISSQADREFASKGFVILGTGDVGKARTFSKDVAIRTPDSLKGTTPYLGENDKIGPVLFRQIGGVTGKRLSIPAVLPALNSRSINVITAPSLGASALQWTPKLTHVTDEVVAFTIGALVMKKSKLDSLPADQKKILITTGKEAGKALTKKIRRADDSTYSRLKKKMTVVKLTSDERSKWKAVFKKTRAELAKGTFPAALVKKIESMGD